MGYPYQKLIIKTIINSLKKQFNMKNQNEIIADLKGLVSIVNDGKEGYKEAAEKVKSMELKAMFMQFSMERSKEVVGNVCLLSGCLDQETSADASINRQFQGAFTYCLIEFIKSNLIRMQDGTFRFNNTVKLRNILKELNCRLDIQGFAGQQSQLSVSKQTDFERTFNP
jgi:hypothetical protein